MAVWSTKHSHDFIHFWRNGNWSSKLAEFAGGWDMLKPTRWPKKVLLTRFSSSRCASRSVWTWDQVQRKCSAASTRWSCTGAVPECHPAIFESECGALGLLVYDAAPSFISNLMMKALLEKALFSIRELRHVHDQADSGIGKQQLQRTRVAWLAANHQSIRYCIDSCCWTWCWSVT